MTLLDGDSEKVNKVPHRLAVVYDALQNDEWLNQIVNWRLRSRLPGEHCYKLGEMYLPFNELANRLQDGRTTEI